MDVGDGKMQLKECEVTQFYLKDYMIVFSLQHLSIYLRDEDQIEKT